MVDFYRGPARVTPARRSPSHGLLIGAGVAVVAAAGVGIYLLSQKPPAPPDGKKTCDTGYHLVGDQCVKDDYPVTEQCPANYTGTWPDCIPPKCSGDKFLGDYPNCYPIPVGIAVQVVHYDGSWAVNAWVSVPPNTCYLPSCTTWDYTDVNGWAYLSLPPGPYTIAVRTAEGARGYGTINTTDGGGSITIKVR